MKEVLIVEEQVQARSQLRQELAGLEVVVVGETGPGPEAFNLARELRPAAVLVGLQEPLVRPLQTIEALSSSLPECPVIALSSSTNPTTMRKAMLAGARDFLGMPVQRAELRRAIDLVVKQAENRRVSRQVRSSHPVEQGCLITVVGPKGGIGKTTMAINLGVSMARSRHNVALVDLDTHVGAAAVMLDLMPRQGIMDLAQSLDQADVELLKTFMTPHPSGLHLLAAPLHPAAGEDLGWEDLSAILGLVTATYEYVVVDLPTVVDQRVERVLRLSTYILLLTSLEVAGIRVTKRHLETMRHWEFAEDKIKLVVNVANAANSVAKTDIEAALDFPVFWNVPYDPHVAMASQAGQSLVELHPTSRAAQAITSLHYALTGVKPVEARGRSWNPFQRLASAFRIG